MKAGTVIKIEIGKTKIVKSKTNGEVSVTACKINGKDREVAIAPIKFVNPRNIMEFIARGIAEQYEEGELPSSEKIPIEDQDILWEKLCSEFAHLDDDNAKARELFDFIIRLK